MTQTTSFLAEDVFFITGRGTVVTGQLQSGTLFPGMKALVNGKSTQVAGIETFRKKIDHLQPGINAGILLPNLERDDLTRNIKERIPIVFTSSGSATTTVNIPSPAASNPTVTHKNSTAVKIFLVLLILAIIILSSQFL